VLAGVTDVMGVVVGSRGRAYPSGGAANVERTLERPGAGWPRGIIGSNLPRVRRPTTQHSRARGETGIKFLRMQPGHGEVLLAEGDPRVRDDEERLVEAFRRQLDEGMWAAVPTTNPGSGRREAQMVREYADIPSDTERVIFFPRASGG
jgi:hypothetical protein